MTKTFFLQGIRSLESRYGKRDETNSDEFFRLLNGRIPPREWRALCERLALCPEVGPKFWPSPGELLDLAGVQEVRSDAASTSCDVCHEGFHLFAVVRIRYEVADREPKDLIVRTPANPLLSLEWFNGLAGVPVSFEVGVSSVHCDCRMDALAASARRSTLKDADSAPRDRLKVYTEVMRLPLPETRLPESCVGDTVTAMQIMLSETWPHARGAWTAERCAAHRETRRARLGDLRWESAPWVVSVGGIDTCGIVTAKPVPAPTAPVAPSEVARNIAHARIESAPTSVPAPRDQAPAPEDDLPPGYGPGDNVPW